MTIKLLGVHPSTYDGTVKQELSALPYPVEVEIDNDSYVVMNPLKYRAHAAWYLTDNPEINKWINKHWEDANQFADNQNNQGE